MQQIVNGALFYCPAFIINGTEPSTQRVDESSNRRTILFWDFIAEIEISDWRVINKRDLFLTLMQLVSKYLDTWPM